PRPFNSGGRLGYAGLDMATDPDGFDLLSWHDCSIHGISFRTGDPAAGDWTSELVLDLDFITDSVRGGSGTQFMLAPTTLVFHDVIDVKINLDLGNQVLHPVSIDKIEREPDKGGQHYLWRVKLNWPTDGEITFGATRFTQTIRAKPIVCEQQYLRTVDRAALS
ncbi:MAG: hypothetical protein V3T86_16885, partial [Planctomycetota bacterium]